MVRITEGVECAIYREDCSDCGGMSTPGHGQGGRARRRQVVARPRRIRWEGLDMLGVAGYVGSSWIRWDGPE